MLNRRWTITELGPAQMVHRLLRFDFTGCTGFLCEGYYWLNISSGGDGLQEYAVVREIDGALIESITVSWTSHNSLLVIVADMFANGQRLEAIGDWRLQPWHLDHGVNWEGNRCALCA